MTILDKIRRLTFDDFKNILIIIGIILAAFIFLRYLNSQAKKDIELANIEMEKARNAKPVIDTSNQTVLSGDEVVTDETMQKDKNAIELFFEYCNSNDVSSAYALLTENCKEKVYPTEEIFEELYYKLIFDTQKTFHMQSWIKIGKVYTYKVTIMEDSLSTGKPSEKVTTDYYTIVEENGEQRINIGEYIARKNINKSIEKNGIKILVNYVDIYLECEIYNITVENNGEQKVELADLKNARSIYLTDTYDSKYLAYMYELDNDKLTIYPGNTNNLEIKFNKMHSSTDERRTTKLIFDDVIFTSGKEEKETNLFINID